MSAVWFCARSELRARRRALAALALIAGMFGGATFAALAGASRTQSAYPRFLERERAYDIAVADSTLFSSVFWKPNFEAIARLPDVRTAVPVDWGFIHAGGDIPEGVMYTGSSDPRFGTEIQRALVVRGRLPRAPDEIAVPYFADKTTENNAREIGAFGLGDRIKADAHGQTVILKVVGETVEPGQIPPRPNWGWQIIVSPAFLRSYQDGCEFGGPHCLIDFRIQTMYVRLQQHGDIGRFRRATDALTGGKVLALQELGDHTRAVQGSTDLQSIALRLLALFLALTGALVVGQLIAREIALGTAEADTLNALGLGVAQRFLLSIVRLAPVALGGAAVALFVGWLASAIFPRGTVRILEGTRLSFDGGILGTGAAAVLLAVIAMTVIPARRATSSGAQKMSPKPSSVASGFAAVGMSAASVAGARLALERGRGRTAVPVVSSLAIVAVGIGAFVAASTFAVNLAGVTHRSELWGKTWDEVISTQNDAFNEDPEAQRSYTMAARAALAQDPDVLAVASIDSGAPTIVYGPHDPSNGLGITAMSIDNVKGSLDPPILEGRAPRDPHEVVLGPRLIKALGIKLDAEHPPTVQIGFQGAGDKRATFRVVGRGVIPPLGNYGQLGYGLWVYAQFPIDEMLNDVGVAPPTTDVIVRWRPGADTDAVITRLKKSFPTVGRGGGLVGGKFADAVNFGGVQGAPLIVGGVLALLGAAALVHVLVTSIRRRRRDLAILKTIGFVRGQARRAVAWQATIMVVIAAAIGTPLGIIGGRWLWRQVAEGIGVLARPALSVITLALLGPSVIVLANLIAAFPARAAARTKPALVLRAE